MRTGAVLAAMGLGSASLFGQSPVQEIGPQELAARLEQGNGIALDVRTPAEVAEGIIGEASVIDFYSEDFARRLSLLRRDVPVYVYCRSGGRSWETAARMKKMGFREVYNLRGGIVAWREAGFETKEPKGLAHGDGKSAAKLWTKDELDALIAAGRPVLMSFSAPWCVPCRRMAPTLEELEAQLEGRAGVAKVDADANTALARLYGVEGVPAFIAFRGGEEVWRGSGVMSVEELAAAVLPD